MEMNLFNNDGSLYENIVKCVNGDNINLSPKVLIDNKEDIIKFLQNNNYDKQKFFDVLFHSIRHSDETISRIDKKQIIKEYKQTQANYELYSIFEVMRDTLDRPSYLANAQTEHELAECILSLRYTALDKIIPKVKELFDKDPCTHKLWANKFYTLCADNLLGSLNEMHCDECRDFIDTWISRMIEENSEFLIFMLNKFSKTSVFRYTNFSDLLLNHKELLTECDLNIDIDTLMLRMWIATLAYYEYTATNDNKCIVQSAIRYIMEYVDKYEMPYDLYADLEIICVMLTKLYKEDGGLEVLFCIYSLLNIIDTVIDIDVQLKRFCNDYYICLFNPLYKEMYKYIVYDSEGKEIITSQAHYDDLTAEAVMFYIKHNLISSNKILTSFSLEAFEDFEFELLMIKGYDVVHSILFS